jgi:hypothetical protein
LSMMRGLLPPSAAVVSVDAQSTGAEYLFLTCRMPRGFRSCGESWTYRS